MNATHLHLLLNHLPVLGTFFALGLLGFAIWRKWDDLKKVAFGAFILGAMFAVPVYLSSEPAEDGVEKLPGVSKPIIELHEDAAALAFTGVLVLGIGALGGLFLFRGGKAVPPWCGNTMTIAAIVVAGAMAWTANLGGQIRHTEIRANAEVPALSDHKSDH